MRLIYVPIILSILGYIKCDLSPIEDDDQNEDEKLITELFTKLNWMKTEIEKINQNINNINERFDSETRYENINLQMLKDEMRELNHTIKTEGMEMRQQLFEKIEQQENLMSKSSTDIEKSFNKTVNKILTDGMEMKQQLIKKTDHQENLMKESIEKIESFNQTVNKILTDGMEMKQQLLKKIDLQENLMIESSKKFENFNKTVNEILTDGTEMKQQLFKKIDHQENLLKESSEKIESFNKTVNKLLTGGMEMKQQLFEKIKQQENLISKSSTDIESFNQTVNKILTDGMEMKQQLLKKIDHQENLMIESSEKTESFNKTVNKILTDGMEMKQQLLKKIEQQENLMSKLSTDNEKSFNKTVNKILTDGMEMKQQLFKKIELQNNLIAKSSKDIESSNKIINKVSQTQPLREMGNWLVILRRQDGTVDFDRNWTDYKNGFGNPNGEYFIGLEKLHAITTYGGPQELLIVLKDFDDNTRYAKYDEFLVGNEAEKYKLKKLGAFSGDAKDSFSQHLNYSFTTRDQDNDNSPKNSALVWRGGWWFHKSYHSHLTGPYFHQPKTDGIHWNTFHGYDYSLKFVEMMIRPKYN